MKPPGKESFKRAKEKAKERATALWQKIRRPTEEASLFANLILATREGGDKLASWFAETFNRNTDIYDKAIDAVYNATHVGGSKLHHIVDGQHSIIGAWRAAHDVLPNDSVFGETVNAGEHLLRDLCSKSGIPLPGFSMSQESFDKFSGAIASTFYIPKSWIADAITVNATEIVGACFAVVPIVLGWKRSDAGRFAEIAGNLGVAAAVSANPLLGILVFVTLARAYTTAKTKEEKTKAKMGLLKGGSASLVFVGTSSIVGGPVWIGIVGGMILANLARKRLPWDKMSEQLASYAVSVNKLLIAPHAENLRGYLASVKTLPASLKSRLANLRQASDA